MTTETRNAGYVALYRSLLNHPLMNQMPAAWFRIFVAILLSVNWKPGLWFDGIENVNILPGSMVSSVEKLSKIAGSTVQQVRSALKYLSATSIVTTKTTSRYTAITVSNWATYQFAGEADNKPDNERNNKLGTRSQQSHNEVGTTIKSRNQENQETTRQGEEQHHQMRAEDDAACPSEDASMDSIPEAPSVYVELAQSLLSLKLSPAAAAHCVELEGRGVNPVTVRAGILLAIQRKRKANINAGVDCPIRSLEYCNDCIEEAILNDMGPMHVAQIESWLRRYPPDWRPPKTLRPQRRSHLPHDQLNFVSTPHHSTRCS